MARYFVAQGLASGQDVLILGERELGRDLVKGCPWLEQSSGESTPIKDKDGAASESEGEGELGVVGQGRGGQRIAWRYDAMGKFKTSTGTSDSYILADWTCWFPLSDHSD
jgi:elongator complex protein 4